MNLSDAKYIATDGRGRTSAYTCKPHWIANSGMFWPQDGDDVFLGNDYADICPPGHMYRVVACPLVLQPTGEPIDMRPKPRTWWGWVKDCCRPVLAGPNGETVVLPPPSPPCPEVQPGTERSRSWLQWLCGVKPPPNSPYVEWAGW
jgi:hypothetical protein